MATNPNSAVAAKARAPRPARAPKSASPRAPRWHVLLLWVLMLATLPVVNPHIRSDGNEYYAYVRSVVIDHDLQFDNEYARAEETFREAMTDELRLMPTGYRRNIASVGPSVLWTPFFLAGHAAAHILQSRGQAVAADGYSWPYLWACAGGTALYAFIGLWLIYRLAMRFASPTAALFATIAVWFASSLPVYLYFLPFHAHAMAMFTVAWFLWRWFKFRDGTDGRLAWFGWGLVGGLVVVTYYLNGVVLIIALIESLVRLVRPKQFVATLTGGVLFLAGVALFVVPALALKGRLDGELFATGYQGTLFFWRDPRLFAVAFSAEHGLFSWTPLLLVAVCGLPFVVRRAPWPGAVLAMTFIAFFYAVAAYQGWHGFSSFGNRFFVAVTPWFVFGLAALSDALCGTHRRRWMTAWAVVGLCILWNAGFMAQWGLNIVPNRGPVDFAAVARNQVTVVPSTAAGFLRQYFGQRERTVRDVERADVPERRAYESKR